MKSKIALLKLIILVFLSGICLTAGAQKLSGVQLISLRAPADIKVDGKTTEWANKFQAYNKATDVFYTLCNDDNNLYLTLQAIDPVVIHKIISSGITFKINKSGTKKDKDEVTITYPIFEKKNQVTILTKDKPVIIPGSTTSVAKADSFMNANNRRFNDKSKLIMVTGITGLDTLISVYNENGIKAVALFDNQMAYTYELAVDLKQLELSVNAPVRFAYNIRLNEARVGVLDNTPGFTITRDANGVISDFKIADGAVAPPKGAGAATDFWGEYTLAKK